MKSSLAAKSQGVESSTVLSPRECKHLRLKPNADGLCKHCNQEIPQYGSVFDTGTIKTFIKVVFIDESKDLKKQAAAAKLAYNTTLPDESLQEEKVADHKGPEDLLVVADETQNERAEEKLKEEDGPLAEDNTLAAEEPVTPVQENNTASI